MPRTELSTDGGWGLEGAAPAVLGVARRAQALAEQVRAGAAVLRRADHGQWTGSAATAAGAAQATVAARLDRCAAQLDDVARVAVAHAHTAEQRADELEELARQARSLLDDVAGRLR
jgi:hypothetical protein